MHVAGVFLRIVTWEKKGGGGGFFSKTQKVGNDVKHNKKSV